MIVEGITTRRAAVKFEELPMQEDLVLRYEVHFCFWCSCSTVRFKYFCALNSYFVLFASGLARGWFFFWRGDAHDDEHPHVAQTRALALPERKDSLGAAVVSILLRIDCV